jgi:AcrR family transcriptional regulator
MAKRDRAGGRSRGPRPDRTPEDRIVDAALQLWAARGWAATSLSAIAAGAGLALEELYRVAPSRVAVLDAFLRRIDLAMLAGSRDVAGDGTVRDRLFEVAMGRFDALQPYRPAVAALAKGIARDPVAMVCLAPSVRRSLDWMLEAAGAGRFGVSGVVRRKGLALVMVSAFRAWLADDSPDMSATMACLDRQLARAEAAVRRCRPASSSGDPAAAASA